MTGIPLSSGLDWLRYPAGVFESNENGCFHRESRRFARSVEAILPLAPAGRGFPPVFAQGDAWLPHETRASRLIAWFLED